MIYVDTKNMVKYDTDKMELVSNKVKYTCKNIFGLTALWSGELYKSKKGNWLGVVQKGLEKEIGTVDEETVKKMLMKYDVDKYEEIFGELEEA